MRRKLKQRLTLQTMLMLLYAAVLLTLAGYFLHRSTWAADMVETYQYEKMPSAQLAFQDGEHHFDSSKYPQSYDISRAEYFFQLALKQDPHLQYVYHELARIAFLQGNYYLALADINFQIQAHGDETPNSYYVRALIEGFMGNYTDAETDYAKYLAFDPIDWAAVNDYSWVLLKDNKPKEADLAISKVLQYFPQNPWLLNSDAIALSELGDVASAKTRIDAASDALNALTPQKWSAAYPGNDPAVAEPGLDAFRSAVEDNMHMIDAGGVAHAVE